RRATGFGIILMPGEEAPPGPPVVWTEVKSSALAVRANQTVSFESALGYIHFIFPASFEPMTVINELGVPVTTWVRTAVEIDGENYVVMHNPTVQTANVALNFTFRFD
ncbi:MAG: hypothetical protein FWD88_05410, partial [Treponema sp.]|nr:hypothetical protein [Treponema sp.]